MTAPTRTVAVPIQCGETTCREWEKARGRFSCPLLEGVDILRGKYQCLGFDGVTLSLDPDGRPLRCEACLRAEEVKDAVATLKKVEQALDECHEAFRRREHGGIAEYNLRHALQDIFNRPYRQFPEKETPK